MCLHLRMSEHEHHTWIGEQVVAYRNLMAERKALATQLGTSVEWVRGILGVMESKQRVINQANLAYGLRKAEIEKIPALLERIDQIDDNIKAVDESLKAVGLPLL
ncbi:hypothetical protein F183_A25970 [Bryobacterales bacterium F-183]|nr:hypothetical protein F183_A25970 [Bryobacterales bacterium F-183]